MMEISSTSGVAERDDEIELTLDLSIGGSYGKSQKNDEEKKGGGQEIVVPRSGFSFSETYDMESMSEAMEDSKRRKEIQSLRRQEAKRKREEKMRKSRKIPIPNAEEEEEEEEEDKLQLKLQQLKAKSLQRGTRENEIALFELPRKIYEFADSLKEKESMQQKQSSCRKGRQRQRLRQEAISNDLLGRSLSVVSDHPTISGKGGSSSECLKTDELLLLASATSDQSDKPNENDTSSSSKETDRATRIRCLATRSPKTSSTEKPNPPTVQSGNHGMDPVSTMPSVSTTGNGPNGKTINGFLYRYSKTDVSIVCVCHGESHTPAEFVEHAGGVDVTNPLRHITMIP